MRAARIGAGDAHLAASTILTVLQILNYRVWLNAARLGITQQDRVTKYLATLPLQLGGLGPTGVTVLCILVAVAAIILARAARRRGASPGITQALIAINVVADVWLLSTMM